MNNQTELIAWGIQSLFSIGYKIEHPPEIIVNTPWSTVIRFFAAKACFYLKQTPPDLFIETEVIKTIQKNVPNSITPTILFEDPNLNCFLMNSCGDYSLRTKFNGLVEPELLVKGLNSYIKILRAFEQNLDALQVIGIPDWRFNHLPQLYAKLLEQETLLIAEGLTHDELDQLLRLIPTIKSLCEFLSEKKVKETLINCDFNENNLIMNEKIQQISIVDWGESVITHPFFSIVSHLHSIARRYKLALNGPFLEKIKQQCLSCWLDVANMNELDIIYQNILRLHPIFCSLAIYRLQVATHNKSKEMQNWFIAGSLKTLLKNEK